MTTSDLGLIEDAMSEMQTEIHRLMELHLEVMAYLARAAQKASNESSSGDRVDVKPALAKAAE